MGTVYGHLTDADLLLANSTVARRLLLDVYATEGKGATYAPWTIKFSYAKQLVDLGLLEYDLTPNGHRFFLTKEGEAWLV